MLMEFEWDDAKAKANEKKHAVPFAYAVRVFLDTRRIVVADTRRDYSEARYIALGTIEKRLYVVAFTQRASAIRIISARKGNKREQSYYKNHPQS